MVEIFKADKPIVIFELSATEAVTLKNICKNSTPGLSDQNLTKMLQESIVKQLTKLGIKDYYE